MEEEDGQSHGVRRAPGVRRRRRAGAQLGRLGYKDSHG